MPSAHARGVDSPESSSNTFLSQERAGGEKRQGGKKIKAEGEQKKLKLNGGTKKKKVVGGTRVGAVLRV